MDYNEVAYWSTCKGIATQALGLSGSGPLADYVFGTVTRSPEYAEKVRAFIQENIKYCSFIVSPKHREMILLQYTHNRRDDALQSMNEDVRECARTLLGACIPKYYALRFKTGRFVVGMDFDFDDVWNEEIHAVENNKKWIVTDRKVAEDAIKLLDHQYKKAKLVMPPIEIVGYDKDQKEIPGNFQYEKPKQSD